MCGITTHEIEEHVREIYGIELSPQFVSRATRKVTVKVLSLCGIEGAGPGAADRCRHKRYISLPQQN
jgi:hypothetical protein